MGATKKDRRINTVLSVLFTILCIAWLYPVFMILMNSLKTERAITTSHAFDLPNAETFVGLKNYIYGIQEMDFLSSFWYSLVITVSSVALILVCCSMCAWYITRVQNTLSKGMYYLCVFSMIVPFQMVMFTLAKTADTLKLNNPYNICIIYLGFGAGLAVFMFTGFVKSMPIAIEEAAMIDGCNPIQIFFKVVCPILKPTMISTAILERLSAAHAGAGHQDLPHDSYGDPVFPRQLRQGGDGTHDGLHHDYGAACYRAVPDLPEIYYRWRGRRCCQGVNLTLLQERGLANDHQRHRAGVRLCGRDRLTSLK